jgi:hypothetical protein
VSSEQCACCAAALERWSSRSGAALDVMQVSGPFPDVLCIEGLLMTSQTKRRQHKRAATTSSFAETDEARRARIKAQHERQARLRAQHAGLVVYPFEEWCALRGISVPTGRRIVAAGKVKVTHLSERRIGIRSDHDLEYLDSCVRDSA